MFGQLAVQERRGAAGRLQELGIDVVGTATLSEQGNDSRGLGQAGGESDESCVGAGACSEGAAVCSAGAAVCSAGAAASAGGGAG